MFVILYFIPLNIYREIYLHVAILVSDVLGWEAECVGLVSVNSHE